MLPLDDPRWQSFQGAYKIAYDASIPLRLLFDRGAAPELLDEPWENLHHQGDVADASYASVPWLVEFVRRSPRLDWNPLGIIATIEMARPLNPEIPKDLSADYQAAIRSLPAILGAHPDQEWDENVMTLAVTCIAAARGQPWFARAYFELDRGTAKRWFSEEFGWNFESFDGAERACLA